MRGLIGKKLGMTSIFNEAGKNIACTVIEAGPCVITQVKTEESDGYEALQLGFAEAKEKNTPNPMMGHFKNAETTPKRKVVEFRNFDLDGLIPPTGESGEALEVTEKSLGSVLALADVFSEGDIVNVVGTSKGKGFQGVVKRHGFSGVGEATHGQHDRSRAPGSIGGSSYPARVFKGMRMAGRMGTDRVKTKGLKVLKLFPEKNYILISGSVPGNNGSIVLIQK